MEQWWSGVFRRQMPLGLLRIRNVCSLVLQGLNGYCSLRFAFYVLDLGFYAPCIKFCVSHFAFQETACRSPLFPLGEPP